MQRDILLPSAAVAFVLLVLAGCQQESDGVAQNTTQPETSLASSENPLPEKLGGQWPVFRGNSHSNGVAESPLPEKLELLWKIKPENAAFEATAAIVDGVVYVAGLDPRGKLYAVDLETGDIQWEYPVETGFQTAPAVRKGVVYLGDSEGKFHAVDAVTGKQKWVFPTDAEIKSSANFYKDNVLFGSYDQSLYCLNAQTGEQVWKFETDGPVHSSATVVENRAFVAGCDQILHVVDLSTGEEVGQTEIKSQAAATPAVRGERLYVGNLGDSFFCINWQKPEIVWEFQHPERSFPYHSSAAVTEEAVVVGGRDRLMKRLDPETGELKWQFPTKQKIDSSPVISGSRVFFGTDGGRLYGLKLADGEKVWEYEAGGSFSASPAVAEGRLVIGNYDGYLFCFGAKQKKAD